MQHESLTFRTARKHLENLQAEADVMMAHHEAMECHDCEALVQLGIDAFDWVMRADSDIRQSLADSLDNAGA